MGLIEILIVVLVLAWLFGSFQFGGSLVHLLLVVIIILILVKVLQRRGHI